MLSQQAQTRTLYFLVPWMEKFSAKITVKIHSGVPLFYSEEAVLIGINSQDYTAYYQQEFNYFTQYYKQPINPIDNLPYVLSAFIYIAVLPIEHLKQVKFGCYQVVQAHTVTAEYCNRVVYPNFQSHILSKETNFLLLTSEPSEEVFKITLGKFAEKEPQLFDKRTQLLCEWLTEYIQKMQINADNLSKLKKDESTIATIKQFIQLLKFANNIKLHLLYFNSKKIALSQVHNSATEAYKKIFNTISLKDYRAELLKIIEAVIDFCKKEASLNMNNFTTVSLIQNQSNTFSIKEIVGDELPQLLYLSTERNNQFQNYLFAYLQKLKEQYRKPVQSQFDLLLMINIVSDLYEILERLQIKQLEIRALSDFLHQLLTKYVVGDKIAKIFLLWAIKNFFNERDLGIVFSGSTNHLTYLANLVKENIPLAEKLLYLLDKLDECIMATHDKTEMNILANIKWEMMKLHGNYLSQNQFRQRMANYFYFKSNIKNKDFKLFIDDLLDYFTKKLSELQKIEPISTKFKINR